MTEQEVRDIVIDVLTEMGASVENQEEVPTVTTIADDSTTIPLVGRSGGQATGYVQISIANLSSEVASRIDPEEAFPDKMDGITQEEFDAIFYPTE